MQNKLKQVQKTRSVKKILLMSVCVSSALTSGMQMSHMPSLASSMSMMQPLQPHPMAPTSSLLTNNMTNIDLSNSQPHNQLLHSQQQIPNNVNDPNEPNSDMLLALIARNKSLEGEFINNLFYCHFITACRRNIFRSYQFSVFSFCFLVHREESNLFSLLSVGFFFF